MVKVSRPLPSLVMSKLNSRETNGEIPMTSVAPVISYE